MCSVYTFEYVKRRWNSLDQLPTRVLNLPNAKSYTLHFVARQGSGQFFHTVWKFQHVSRWMHVYDCEIEIRSLYPTAAHDNLKVFAGFGEFISNYFRTWLRRYGVFILKNYFLCFISVDADALSRRSPLRAIDAVTFFNDMVSCNRLSL